MVKSHTHYFSETTEPILESAKKEHSHTVSLWTYNSSGNYYTSAVSHGSYGTLIHIDLKTDLSGTWCSDKSKADSVNIDHTHTFSGTTHSNNSDALENRPINYTVRVWKRTA